MVDISETLMQTTENPGPKSLPMPFFGSGGRILLFFWWYFYGQFVIGKPKTLAALKKRISTPWEMQAYLYNVITYKSDKAPEDHWQPAQRTIDRSAGDCEDWAILANDVLGSNYKCWFLCMYTMSSGHATLLIKDGPQALTSIGTFGIMWHATHNCKKIIPSWSGYDNWVHAELLDNDLQTIRTLYR